MREHCVAHRQRVARGCGEIQRQHQVHAGVDLGVMRGRLRHAEERIDFRQQLSQRAAATQDFEK
jgi:hypothetical protein